MLGGGVVSSRGAHLPFSSHTFTAQSHLAPCENAITALGSVPVPHVWQAVKGRCWVAEGTEAQAGEGAENG